MKTRHISYLILLISLILALPAAAQKMTVESMVHDPFDQTANLSENMYKDNNQEYGGLVKVMLAASNATFEGWVLKQQAHSVSEYWVFMAKGSNRLKVTVPGYLPLEVNFSDYEDCIVKSCHTYVLTITLPQVGGNVQADDGMRFLAMIVSPKNSMVLVDGNPQLVDENGEVVVRLRKGTHRYQVSAAGYEMKEGTVDVGDNNTPLNVSLISTLATLRVECPTSGAEIFVDGQSKGRAPWSGTLMYGEHLVEARLNGYYSRQQSISLSEKEKRTLNIPALQQIVGSLSVECRPIGSEVYVDGRKIGTTPNVFRDIPVGQRRVEIRKEDYETMTKTVTVEENKQASVTGALTAVVAATPSNPSSPSSSSSKETFTVKGVSFTMIRVDGGTFTMGATSEQGSDAYDWEKPTHKVTLSTYMIGETEVTQELWQAVMGENPSRFKGKSDSNKRPVEQVSWDDCQTFIKKLNQLTGRNFRLPTEAEWEFAARGGTKSRHSKYAGGNDIGSVAWYWDNTGTKGVSSPDYGTHPVGRKAPNELGIYDMSGNVCEWCSDLYGDYSSSAQTNPKGPSSGTNRVLRGGSWSPYAGYCRVSYRCRSTPGLADYDLGLRLAL